MSRLPPNARILEFKILSHLGSGGFANTYLALDVNLNKKVAIKEFFPHRLCDRGEDFNVIAKPGSEEQFTKFLRYFITEAQILAKFDEENIVKVLRYFEGLGTAFIIMDFVEGKRLDEYIADNEIFSDLTIRRWLEGLLHGIGVIHEANIIHGDIKPSNIIVTESNQPVLIDFGASVVFHTMEATNESYDQLFLTHRYAAPEALKDPSKIDHRFDLFALGAIFFEIIAHEKFQDTNAPRRSSKEILAYGRHHDAKLLRSIDRALRDQPGERFGAAHEWLNFLTLSSAQKFARGLKRHKLGLAASLLLLAAVGYGVNYVKVNEIDQRNYKYKLFTSQAKVDGLLSDGAGYAAKVAAAQRYLSGYSNEFKSHLRRLDDSRLVTSRNNKATLQAALKRTDEQALKLIGLREKLLAARRNYYFDDYRALIDSADAVVKSIEPSLFENNQQLLAAVVENGAVAKGQTENVNLDRADLAAYITRIQAAKDRFQLERLVALAEPRVDQFINSQKRKNARQALEAFRRRIKSAVGALHRKYKTRRRGGEIAAVLAELDRAGNNTQIAALGKKANGIVATIERETRTALARRKQLILDSQIRSAIQKVEAGMISIAGGSFKMGGNDQGYARPIHAVAVKPFFMGVNEVTVGQWKLCVKDGKCRAITGGKGDGFPVTKVSWDDTQKFIGWLNGRSSRYKFRLPAEAEWEYVVKKFGYKLKELQPKLDRTSVDNRNTRGVNSIVGNALEWLDDCWHGGYFGAPTDGSSWNKGLYCSQRVVRGSHWKGKYDIDQNKISYFRPVGLPKQEKRDTLGFRLAGTRK